MASEPIRNPHTDQLLTPDNSALIIIDYQPVQVSSIRSMPRDELVFNITSVAKAALNYNLPIIHSTVNVATGRNKPPIQALQAVLGHLPTYDRTSINSWEDTGFKQAVKALGRKKLIRKAMKFTCRSMRWAARRSPHTRQRCAEWSRRGRSLSAGYRCTANCSATGRAR